VVSARSQDNGGIPKKLLGERSVIDRKKLEATIEPFDSFWKAPDNINKDRRNPGNSDRELWVAS